MDHQHRLMLIRDLLDRLSDNADAWERADDQSVNHWEKNLRRDMAELRRMCATIRSDRFSGLTAAHEAERTVRPR
jgi:uncharacterized protein YaeQ